MEKIQAFVLAIQYKYLYPENLELFSLHKKVHAQVQIQDS